MSLKKMIAATLCGVVAVACVSFAPATAYGNMNFTHNWTNDTGLNPANGSTNGRDGRTTFRTNPQNGTFSASWTTTRMNSGFNNLHGVGWRTGTNNRRIGYNVGYLNHTSGTRGMTIATFYGWTRSPLIEYYVIEMWRNHRSTPGTRIGTLNSDGGSYEIWRANRNSYNIDGFGPFIQLKSVRTASAPTGQNRTITFQNHVNAWASAGQRLGTHYYQVFQLEGWESDGSGNGTIWVQ
jgi:hypothetical protein